jgi:tRNA pseudouridine55 synthase
MIRNMFGFININKPAGPTSHDIVAAVRRALPRHTKVGHAGTLDPFATGVLVVGIGPATRLAEYVQAQPKRYRATVTLGATSPTDDATGEITPHSHATPPSRSDVEQAAGEFTGQIQQVPPAHSAVYVNGERAYKLARRGEQLDLPARTVQVYGLNIVRYDWPELVLDVHCGSGTYIRSLARDLGERLGVGGYCQALTRTAIGGLTVEKATSLEAMSIPEDIIDPLNALDMPVVRLSEQAAEIIAHGRSLDVTRLAMPPEAVEFFAAVGPEGRLLAVAKLAEGGEAFRPVKVFSPPIQDIR